MLSSYLPWLHPEHLQDRPWLRDRTCEVTYGEGRRWIAILATQLTAAGVKSGDVVAVMMSNRVELPLVIMAAWRIGAAATPVNPALTTREAAYQIEDANARIVVHDNVSADLGAYQTLCVEGLARADSAAPTADQGEMTAVEDDAVALLIYTSGSTGKPKGVMLTHTNLDFMSRTLVQHFRLTETDHCLLVLPLFHVNAICVSLLASTLAGGQLTLLRRFEATDFLTAVQQYRPTYFSVVPTILARIMELPEFETAQTDSLRFVVCGAAPVSAELLRRFEQRLGAVLVEGYGLTEGTCVSCCNPLEARRVLGSVGPALSGQEIRIVTADGMPAPVGQVGEVTIRGDNIMRGYLNKPEATAETVVDGWLHTGDVGRLDENGYLFLVDRIKDMIIRGGENLYPKEIENALYTHPAVLEAAVVGCPDEVYGEVPVAFVVPYSDTNVDPAELRAHVGAYLTKIKVPVQITVLDTIPKNPVGKIDKPGLRSRLRA